MILALGITTFSYTQQMGELKHIKANNKIIDCSPPYAAPCIYDYDKDSLDDLIIGTFSGKFRFYKNTGTKNKPRYFDFSFIRAAGKDAKVPNG